MNEEIELLQKEILKLEKEIEKYRKKINTNQEEKDVASHSQQIFSRLVREIENRFSDYLTLTKKKSLNLSQNDKFAQNYVRGVKQVFNSSAAYKIMGRLEDDMRNTKKISSSKDEEIYQWKKKIETLEEELQKYKNELTKLGR